jgi:hypothetical protein
VRSLIVELDAHRLLLVEAVPPLQFFDEGTYVPHISIDWESGPSFD